MTKSMIIFFFFCIVFTKGKPNKWKVEKNICVSRPRRFGKSMTLKMLAWDCVMRERRNLEELQKPYLDFLRNLLKDQPYVALAYMTGILPVKNTGNIRH